MRKWLKHLTGRTIFGMGWHRSLFANAAIIVTFHRVNDTIPGDGLTCSVRTFKKWCQFFADHFHVVSLQHLVEEIKNGTPPKRELVITFDDGYRDNYEHAAPLLNAMGLPATFFVVTQFIDRETVPWWDGPHGRRLPWMTWDQVRGLYTAGFEIGAHTRTHVNLGEVSGEAARVEIVGSRLDLEDKLSGGVRLFAYPYGGLGDMTETNREIVKAAGYECCCSCFGGINNSRTDPHYLRRIPISSWYASPYEFAFEAGVSGLK